jgi:hypothetical protein
MTGTAWAASFCVTTTPKRDAISAMPDQDRRAFCQHPTFGNEARRLRDRFGEQPAGSEISALRRIHVVIARPQGEHLQAGEGTLRVREILPLAARDVPNRPQHDDGRDREFYRQRGETKAATHGPRRRANALCSRRDAALGSFSMVRSATASAASSALMVAAATALEAASGSAPGRPARSACPRCCRGGQPGPDARASLPPPSVRRGLLPSSGPLPPSVEYVLDRPN